MSLRDLEVSRAFPALRIRVAHASGPLCLRPTLISDAEAIAAAVNASIPELKPFMPWAHVAQTARSQLERLRGAEPSYFSGKDMLMGLFRESDGAMLCGVSLHPRVALNPKGLEVGYWAPTEHAGKGWTTLGVQVLVVYAFDKLRADRVQVMCDVANVKSRRVIEKCGFVQEGILRNMLEAPTPELTLGGYQGTEQTVMSALCTDTFEALPWVAELRARMTYVNLGGYEIA